MVAMPQAISRITRAPESSLIPGRKCVTPELKRPKDVKRPQKTRPKGASTSATEWRLNLAGVSEA